MKAQAVWHVQSTDNDKNASQPYPWITQSSWTTEEAALVALDREIEAVLRGQYYGTPVLRVLAVVEASHVVALKTSEEIEELR